MEDQPPDRPPDHSPGPDPSDPEASARYRRYVTKYNDWLRLYHADAGSTAPEERWPMLMARLAYHDAKLDYLFPGSHGPPDAGTQPWDRGNGGIGATVG